MSSMNRGHLLAWCACVALLLSGISCSPSLPPDPGGSAYPDNSLDLSDANNRTLTEVSERLRTLAGGGSTSQAATALLGELQAGRAGVSSAVLGGDGYTILLKMSDNSPALINTNTAAFSSESDSQAAAAKASQSARLMADKAVGQRAAYTISSSAGCSGQVIPATTKTLIMNIAAISHPNTNGYVTELRDALVGAGWSPGDITVRTRQGDENHAFTPLSMTDVSGFDLVFIIAQGCMVDPGDGVQHAYLQCCRAGSMIDVMQPEQWLTISGERNNGRLIRCQTVTESGAYLNEVYARDDLLIEQMSLNTNAMVYFIAPNSWTVANGLGGRGAGSALGWQGSFSGKDGQLAALGMLRRMTADNTYTTDAQAFESLTASGQASSYGPGGIGAFAKLAAITGDFYMPAWARFSVDTEHFPSTATQAKVQVRYADCPSFAMDFTMGVSESPDAGLMPAGEATVTVEALNAAGETVGTGLQRVAINGGLNEIKLATCTGTAKVHLGYYPTDGANATTKIRMEFTYPTAMADAPDPVELNPADAVQWSMEIPAGKIQVHATAINAAGHVVGEKTTDVEVECDISPINVCFGWVKLQASKTTPNTAKVQVTSDSEQAAGPFTFSPGGSVQVCGLKVGQVVNFTAVGLDSGGNPVSTASQSVTVTCGENTVDLDLTNYGILLSAQPNQIAADGLQSSLITATLRYWKAGDSLAPTGDPVVGKSVQFSTTLGTLSGVNPATTNAAGQANIQLSSTQDGAATVTAFVSEDHRQNSVIVAIGDTEEDMTLFLKWDPHYRPNEALVEANVRHKDGTPAGGVPVHFRMAGGQMTLIGDVDRVTIGSGTTAIVAHADGPAYGLIEATIPGTTLIKRKLLCLGVSVETSPAVALLQIDKDEVILTAHAVPDPGELGFPAKASWHTGQGQIRKIRGGTAEAWARYQFYEIPNTTQARVSHGIEPDTSARIGADLSFLVDGEWSESIIWTGTGVSATVSFVGEGRTVAVRCDSTQEEVEGSNPKLYRAMVQAYFPVDGPEGRVRYIINNNKDNGTDPIPGKFADGTNSTTSACPSGCRYALAAEGYMGEEPGAWIAQKLQEYQAEYGHLTVTVYGP